MNFSDSFNIIDSYFEFFTNLKPATHDACFPAGLLTF